MTLLCLELPQQALEPLWDLKVPGTREPINKAHVTMVYFGKGGSVAKDFQALEVIEEIVLRTGPFLLTIPKVTSFDPSESSDGLRPIIGQIVSPELVALRGRIANALDQAGVPFSKSFPDYHPHVTMSYQDPKEPWQDIKLATPIKLQATSCSMLFGSHGDTQQTTVRFPLMLQQTRKASRLRVASRWLAQA